uniref:DNA polymerase III subunit alpha n=1 Tax=Cacopsylla melanoneura TaxID=428564 RepID=A0A8D8Z2A9_9HEMI
MINFTHLNLHTEYSFIDSIIKTGQIINIYKELNYKAICITDILTISSFYEYYFYCYDNEVKPLIGVECFILFNGNLLGIILIAKNFLGYKNIMHILSNAWRYGNIENGVFLKLHWLINFSKNLILIINPRYYILNKNNFSENELNFMFKQLFFLFENDIYFELIRVNLPFEKYINKKIKKIKFLLI